jgi:hypothetical protein
MPEEEPDGFDVGCEDPLDPDGEFAEPEAPFEPVVPVELVEAVGSDDVVLEPVPAAPPHPQPQRTRVIRKMKNRKYGELFGRK